MTTTRPDSNPAAPDRVRPSPGDEAAPGTPGTGEDICPDCNGSGRTVQGGRCPNCEGSGKIIRGIGGA